MFFLGIEHEINHHFPSEVLFLKPLFDPLYSQLEFLKEIYLLFDSYYIKFAHRNINILALIYDMKKFWTEQH